MDLTPEHSFTHPAEDPHYPLNPSSATRFRKLFRPARLDLIRCSSQTLPVPLNLPEKKLSIDSGRSSPNFSGSSPNLPPPPPRKLRCTTISPCLAIHAPRAIRSSLLCSAPAIVLTPPAPSAATTLTGLHFAVTAMVGFVSNATGYSASKHVPLWELLWFSIVANTSITGMNLSLMLNSVGFYQVAHASPRNPLVSAPLTLDLDPLFVEKLPLCRSPS